MNLVNKLIIDYEECVDIINPFFFELSTEVDRVPEFIFGAIEPRSFSRGRRKSKVELSANPDNIKLSMTDIRDRKELTIFNRNQLFILQDIMSIEWTLSAMTGCIEFKIECGNFIIGGNNE